MFTTDTIIDLFGNNYLLLFVTALLSVAANLFINVYLKNKSLFLDSGNFWNLNLYGFSKASLNTFLINKTISNISLLTTAYFFVVTLFLLLVLKNPVHTLLYPFSNLTYTFSIGLDGLSTSFIALNAILTALVLLYNYSNYNNFLDHRSSLHTNIFLILLILITNVFLVENLILFYVFFESILPVLFILIAVYGSSQRISAAYYLFIYTLSGSMFLLLAFILVYLTNGTMEYYLINTFNILNYNIQVLIYILMMIGIITKIPLLPLHTWLPLAHSESVIGGSVLLAGIVLKMAIYAFVKILLNVVPEASLNLNNYLTVLAVITLFYSSLVTLRNLDNKVIIAYSSIAHMAIAIIGLTSNTFIGLQGGVILSIAHGFVSPALFILLGAVLYEKYHTRLIHYYKGISTYYPIFAIIFFVTILCNTGIPLSINFIGEFLSIVGALYKSLAVCILASCTLLLSSAYSIWLFSRISDGYFTNNIVTSYYSINNNITKIDKLAQNYIGDDLNKPQLFTLLTLVYLTFLLGISTDFIINLLDYDILQILYL